MSFVSERRPPEPQTQPGHIGLRTYVTGFVLAVILTAIPFALVMAKVASPDILLPAVFVIGALQMVVHFKYFLHLTDGENGHWNISALLLTGVIVTIVLSGSLWVMYELNRNMMPWMFNPGTQQSMQTMPM
jgi:cytochrome o ubiquinol oxidase subunit IV